MRPPVDLTARARLSISVPGMIDPLPFVKGRSSRPTPTPYQTLSRLPSRRLQLGSRRDLPAADRRRRNPARAVYVRNAEGFRTLDPQPPVARLRMIAPVGKLLTMSKATDPQRIAELCRRVAAIPTSGGHRADRALLTLAGKLDREATALEHRGPVTHLTEDQLFDFRR